MKFFFFEKNDDKMYKAWVALYKCASTRAILLDLVPRPNSTLFSNSFGRMIARRGCPNNMISDNGKNWDLNLPFVPWHRWFFKHLARSTKTLLKKAFQNYRLI